MCALVCYDMHYAYIYDNNTNTNVFGWMSGRKHLMSETCQHNENEFNIMDIRQSEYDIGRPRFSLCVCVCLKSI